MYWLESSEAKQSFGKGRSKLFYIGLILVSALILSSWFLSSSYLQLIYRPSANNNVVSEVPLNVLFNYGNGTRTWYNTTVRSEWNFYNVTEWLANNRVESGYFPQLHEHLIQSINGVRSTGNYYWQLWVYCTGKSAWLYSAWGADMLRPVSANTVQVEGQGPVLNLRSNGFAWAYQYAIIPPISGATRTDNCT